MTFYILNTSTFTIDTIEGERAGKHFILVDTGSYSRKISTNTKYEEIFETKEQAKEKGREQRRTGI